MKIAMVVTGGLHPSGEEQVVPSLIALFERLAAMHQIHAFALKHLPEPKTYSLHGFTVHDLGRPSGPIGLARWAQERALGRALDAAGPFDVIHGFWADPAGQLAARAAQQRRIPSVVTCDSGEFVSIPEIGYGSQRTANGRRAVKEACALATRVHVCTKFMSALAAENGVATTVIPLTSVTSGPATLESASASRSSGSFRLVQVASLSRVKNQKLLIDALPIVRGRVDAHLDLVGEDTLNGELQEHAANIGLTDHVTFHGFLPQRRVMEILENSHLYVQSSLHEAAGVSVLEAAACGVASVGTRAGYIADWSPSKALAIGDATAESLADAIVTMHADAGRRRSMAALARTVSIAHDADRSAAQFDELYQNLTT